MKSAGFSESLAPLRARSAFRWLCCAILAALWLPAAVHGQQSLGVHEFDRKSGTKASGRSVFDPPAPSGYTPVIVEITNGTASDLSWTSRFSTSSGYRQAASCSSIFSIDVNAGKSNTVTLSVPVLMAPSGGRWGKSSNGSMHWSISAAGLGNFENTQHWSWSEDWPAVAISESLAAKNLTQLADEAKKISGRSYGNSFFGSRFVAADLPEDWIGYSGFDALMLTDVEWQKMSAGARTAIGHWVHLGGSLRVYSTSNAMKVQALGLGTVEPGAAESASLGMGKVEMAVWNGADLDIPATAAWAKGHHRRQEMLEEHYAKASRWRLPDALKTYAGGSWQVIVFLILFGLIIGPVNLFVLAPAGKRYKLFLTTPLISLGAGVLLVLLILFQDGTGGRGLRSVFVELAPGEATGYVTQEQFCRTGVLFSSSFTPEPAALVEPLILPSTPFTKLDNSSNSQGVTTTFSGSAISGNWFQSRAEQAQHIATVVPTRSRIEFGPKAADGRPTVISSLDAEIVDFLWIDNEGKRWIAAGPLRKGQRVSLQRLEGESATVSGDLAQKASEPTFEKLEKWKSRKESFLARAESAPGFTVETLRSIRWERTDAFFYGSLPAQP